MIDKIILIYFLNFDFQIKPSTFNQNYNRFLDVIQAKNHTCGRGQDVAGNLVDQTNSPVTGGRTKGLSRTNADFAIKDFLEGKLLTLTLSQLEI